MRLIGLALLLMAPAELGAARFSGKVSVIGSITFTGIVVPTAGVTVETVDVYADGRILAKTTAWLSGHPDGFRRTFVEVIDPLTQVATLEGFIRREAPSTMLAALDKDLHRR